MPLISPPNRGAPLAGPNAQSQPLGGNQAKPPSSFFEALAHPGSTPASGDEKALSKEQQEALDRRKEISEALDKNDLGKLRDLAKDPKAMAAATPEQKAAALKALSKDGIALAAGNRDDREAIVKLLASAGSDAEYQSLMQSAGPELVRQAMTTGVHGPEEKRVGLVGVVLDDSDRRLTATFDTIAGAHGCSAYASSPENAAMAEKALARGYTSDQIVAARLKSVDAQGDSPKVKNAADDPLAMMVTTAGEKSEMLKQLMDGWTKDSDDRGMVNILESCEDKAEFDKVIDGAGGRAVVDELDDDEAKRKANLLCGAYDRADCATDQKLAAQAHGELTDPVRVHYLLNGADEAVVPPQTQARSGDLADDYLRQSRAATAAMAATLDRKTVVETVLANSDRLYNGKAMFDPRAVRGDVNQVMADPSLNDEQREKKIEELRNQQGLSEYTMRNIATQPLARIYENQTMQAARFAAVGEMLEQQRAMQAMQKFGADSPQAQLALQAAYNFHSEMEPYVKGLQGAAQKLEDLYPPPKGFWESVGGFLGNLAMAVAPALLNFIPVVGTALYAGYEGVKMVVDAANGNLAGVLGDVAGVLPVVGGVAGQVTGAALKGAVGIEQAVEHGDLLGGITAGLTAAGGIAGGLDSPVAKDIAELAKDGTQIYRGLKDGDFAAIAAGAGDIAGLDPQAKQVLQGSAGTIQAITRGDAEGALAGLAGTLGGFDNPTLQDLAKVADQSARFTRALRTGDFGAAFTGVEGLLRQVGAGPAVDALTQAVAPLNTLGLNPQNAGTLIDLVTALGRRDGAAALNDVQGLVRGLGGGEALDKLKNEVLAPFQKLGVDGPAAQGVLQFARSVANGDVGQALQTLGAEAGRLGQSPELQKAIGLVQDGTALASALQQGRFSDAMQRLGLPARDVGAVRQAETLFKALQNGDFAPLARTEPARQLLQSAQSLAQKLGSGQALDDVNRLTGAIQQLRDATLPGFDQGLVAQANQLLSQAQRLARG